MLALTLFAIYTKAPCKTDSGGEAVKLPVTVNQPRYTSTQPCITSSGPDGYMLYYVTNRPEGAGKLDIWKAARSTNGVYATPANLGNIINTSDDDVSPFITPKHTSLYFFHQKDTMDLAVLMFTKANLMEMILLLR